MESFFSLPYNVICILSSLFLFPFLLCILRRRRPPPKSAVPSPASYPIVGNTIALLRNRRRFYDWATDLLALAPSNTIRVHGPVFTPRGICTAHPPNVAHLLRSKFTNYVKGSRFSSPLSDLLGDGIFVADGDHWLSQRKIASYEFNTKSLKSFITDTVQEEISTGLLPFLSAAADSSTTFDLQDVLQRFAFDNICNLAFGEDPRCLRPHLLDSDPNCVSSFLSAFDEAVEICSARALAPVPLVWKILRWLNIGSERRLKRAIEIIDDYAMMIIEKKLDASSREKAGSRDADLLSRFIRSSESSCDPKFLRDIVISFVLAGKDSTSTALAWFFWLLSENPRCEQRIYSELMTVAWEAGIPSFEQLKEMNYLHAAISEALRLFPPVPIDSRVAVADDVLPDGTVVRAGWFADYCAYAMGRMERVWGEDCREYKPERWLKGESFVAVDQFTFPVFHGGPRVCLGKDMAYLQMKAVAASVVREFLVEPAARLRPAYTLSLTLKMKDCLPVRVRRRSRLA